MRFELNLAWRHLTSGGGQTLLTVCAVAVAVTVVIFIQALISGVQRGLIGNLVDPSPHVTILPREPRPRTLAEIEGGANDPTLVRATRRQELVSKRGGIREWRALTRQAVTFPGVKTVAPVVRGSAFLIRGEKRIAVQVTGADPRIVEGVTPLQNRVVAGRWLTLGPRDLVIGNKLAEDARLAVGDKVRLQAAEGNVATFTVAGIVERDDGGTAANMTLSAAQGLFAADQSISAVLLKLTDPFRADEVADLVKGSLGYETNSWSRDAGGFLTAIQAQGFSSLLISTGALLASAFAIASVLIISVIQKTRQIGILKSMGATDRQILTVFTLEGLVIAAVGSLLGCLAGYGLLRTLDTLTQTTRYGRVEKVFPIVYTAELFVGAVAASIAITLIAAAIPARRASRLNPVEVIRNG